MVSSVISSVKHGKKNMHVSERGDSVYFSGEAHPCGPLTVVVLVNRTVSQTWTFAQVKFQWDSLTEQHRLWPRESPSEPHVEGHGAAPAPWELLPVFWILLNLTFWFSDLQCCQDCWARMGNVLWNDKCSLSVAWSCSSRANVVMLNVFSPWGTQTKSLSTFFRGSIAALIYWLIESSSLWS